MADDHTTPLTICRVPDALRDAPTVPAFARPPVVDMDATPRYSQVLTPVVESAPTPVVGAEPRPRSCHHDAVPAELLIDRLPDSNMVVPDGSVLRRILEQRVRCETAVIRRLAEGPSPMRSERVGHRAELLVAIVGEWRAAGATTALIGHLETERHYGDAELVHALTRIGPAAMTPLMFVLFDRDRSAVARRRAARALASIAMAACDYGHDDAWPGDPDQQYAEACAALHLTVCRAPSEPDSVVAEAAAHLCSLRYESAWATVEGLYSRDVLPGPTGISFDEAVARVAGESGDLGLGAWRTSMVSWLLGERFDPNGIEITRMAVHEGEDTTEVPEGVTQKIVRE